MACTQVFCGPGCGARAGGNPPPELVDAPRRPLVAAAMRTAGRGKVGGTGTTAAGHRLSLARAGGRWQPTRRQQSSPRGGVKAPKFSYVRAVSLEQVLELLERYGEDAQILAGGQSLMPALNMRLSAPQL